MAVPPFVINHGEKVLVGLVVLGCLYWVASTMLDTSTSSELTDNQVTAAFNRISEGKGQPGQLNPTPPKDYAAQLRDRLTVDLQDTQIIPFIHEHPDVRIDVEGGQLYPYIYLLGQPRVELSEELGTLNITVIETISGINADNQRVTDARSKQWTRSVKEGDISNSARLVGVLLEMRADDDEWAPLRHPKTPGGVLLSKNGSYEKITVGGLEEWRKYEVRARQIAVATGFLKTLGGEVIALDAAKAPDFSAINWNQIRVDAAKGGLSGMLTPYEKAIPGLTPTGKERVFVADAGEPDAVTIKASVLVALSKVSTIANPPIAHILVTKRLPSGWTPPREFKVEVGKVVGEEVVMRLPPNNENRKINLKTPYILDEVAVKDLSRIYNYEIRLGNNLQTGQKELSVKPTQKSTNTATVTNQVTGDKVVLVKLEKALRITNDNARKIAAFAFNQANNNEWALFQGSPDLFVQPVLTAQAPIPHEPGAGPLSMLGADLVPNPPVTTYYELSDGRLLYIDPLNDGAIKVEYKPGVQRPQAGAPAGAAAADQPKAGNPRGGKPVPVPIPGMR